MRHCLSTIRGSDPQDIPYEDLEAAFLLAARILTMASIKPTDYRDPIVAMSKNRDEFGQRPPSHRLAHRPPPKRLHPRSLPRPRTPQPAGPRLEAAIIKPSLTVTKIIKIAGLTIKGTSNLRDHLKLNNNTGVVEIFHHTTFLKEHLPLTHPDRSATLVETSFSSEKPSLPTIHPLPRDLALETIYTIYFFFTFFNSKGASDSSTLRTLIANQRFDPDCLNFGTSMFETREEKKRVSTFPVWGSRLMDLYEIENPKPRAPLDMWLERKSPARYIMMVTIFSFLAAVVLGFLSLCLGFFQAWIAWERWKDG
ncbi:hypothetical protein B0T14DRAFT_594889, partial [Immersiella caudata]